MGIKSNTETYAGISVKLTNWNKLAVEQYKWVSTAIR